MRCPDCERQNIVKNGSNRQGAQAFRCADCHRSHRHSLFGSFLSARRHRLAVRWYLRFRLRYADVIEWRFWCK
jgi:transposase-like protein